MFKLSARPLAIFALVAILLAGGGWYALGLRGGEATGDTQCDAGDRARLKSLAKGELAALAVKESPKPPPAIAFNGPDGQPLTLASFSGRTVLVNLWATWCVPCREEMPALDKLQAQFGGKDFEVVAINVDTRNAEKPKVWLKDNHIGNLAYYADPTGKLLQVLQKSGHAVGLPTTLLIDGAGCEVAVLKGPAEWASPDAFAFIQAALAKL